MNKIRVATLASHFSSVVRHLEVFSEPKASVCDHCVFLIKPQNCSLLRFVLSNFYFLATHPDKLSSLIKKRSRLTLFFDCFDNEGVLTKIRNFNIDVGLHAYPMIYRGEQIACFKLGILNAHIGLLPFMQGRSVVEWSILERVPIGITTFFIDEGIDTGDQIVHVKFIDDKIVRALSLQQLKTRMFSLDAECYLDAVLNIFNQNLDVRVGQDRGQRYYRISKMFFDAAEELKKQIGV